MDCHRVPAVRSPPSWDVAKIYWACDMFAAAVACLLRRLKCTYAYYGQYNCREKTDECHALLSPFFYNHSTSRSLVGMPTIWTRLITWYRSSLPLCCSLRYHQAAATMADGRRTICTSLDWPFWDIWVRCLPRINM